MAAAFKVLFFVIALTIKASDTENVFEEADKKPTEMESLRQIVSQLYRQTMLQQLFAEERIRSDGDSGVKQVRTGHSGTRNYHSATHSSSKRIVAMHDHANNIRTVGLGEFIAVLNGVEFRTRHNDYRLYMASKTSKDYHATEEIPFPEVPPEVKNKTTVDEQIVEMREWFKAWKNQDHSVRDYRKYFKPVLCYLEGAWTTATGDIDEPFESDRHFIDAKSWSDLQEKIRFTSYTGRKDNLENFSFLPTTIMEIINGTIPVFAQWNYRILCHPLSRDVPLNRFRVIDELHSRLPARRKYEETASTRAARFQLNPIDGPWWPNERLDVPPFTLLDQLMSEIPGKDNYQGNLTDEAFELPAYTVNPKEPSGKKLNAAFYHRSYKVKARGAMGQTTRHRGYADTNLFMAMNSQSRVAGMTQETCQGSMRNPRCTSVSQKFSYAIPLEIIYMTPLSRWNPHDIEYKGSQGYPLGKTVFEGGRNGRTPEKAYNGTNSRKFYQTPSAFFSGLEVSTDAADTTQDSVKVLDKKSIARDTRASGTRIFFPEITGVGVLRQRYPIMPVHGEGSAVWKELEAVKDLLMKSQTYFYMYRQALWGSGGVMPTEPADRDTTLKMEDATKTPPGAHTHEITLTSDEVKAAFRSGRCYRKYTTEMAGHQHEIGVCYRHSRWIVTSCDDKDSIGGRTRCWDKHGVDLHVNANA